MNGYEKEINSREEQKNKIRARYRGVDRSELEFIPAKQKEKLFEETGTKRVCAYCRVSTDDVNQTSSYELQKNHYEDMIKEHQGWELPDADMTEAEENTVDTSENKTKKIVRTLFPKQWQNHFGCSSEDVVLLHRVKYCGNWDVLRPAKIVEGMGLISENLLEKLNNEAHSMIEKMGCAV